FVPFFMIQNQRIGLGLSIAQHIISAHCGDIRVEDGQGKGTTFMVELPVAKDAPKASKKREMALQEH
ncbi:MAG: ATP-binding protein, partial [bacterium]